MAATFTLQKRESFGSKRANLVAMAADSSYATGGYAVTPAQVGLKTIDAVIAVNSGKAGYEYDYVTSTGKILIRTGGSAASTTGATSGGTPAAQTFTGTASALNLATPVFSGTGFATAGQVVTTTDNQTMTLNQCAGMWLIADALTSTAPVLIASNTAVTGAPAVLTVIGTAPATDAGTYKIVATIPVGTNGASAALATHTHTVSAGAEGEVANATNLASAITAVQLYFIGE